MYILSYTLGFFLAILSLAAIIGAMLTGGIPTWFILFIVESFALTAGILLLKISMENFYK